MLIVTVGFVVSVLLDVHDGMSTREAAVRSAVPAVLLIVLFVGKFRRDTRRAARHPN